MLLQMWLSNNKPASPVIWGQKNVEYIKVSLSVILDHSGGAISYKYGLFNDETYEDHFCIWKRSK